MATNARFKIDIYGDTANFENSLKGINSAMSNLKGEASQLRKELRLDPTNVSAMSKLQANLAQQLEVTKQKASNLKQEMSNVDKSTPEGQKRWLTLQKQLSENSLKANALEGDIKEVGQAIERGNWKADIDVSQAESSINRVKKGFSTLREIGIGALRQIGSSAVSALGNGLRGWVSGAMDTQKAMISLENTMKFKGIGGGFKNLSGQMSKLATDTNANTEDTLKLATTFVGLGDTADVAGKKTTNLVKANQAFGGTGENLKGVVQAYGQMSAAGKVTADNINQLTDNNTALGSALKSTVMEMNPALKQYGSFAAASEAGAVSIDMLDKAMGKLGKAGGGQIQTIGDAWDSFNETMSLALLPTLQALTPTISNVINMFADWGKSAGENLVKVVGWVQMLFKVLHGNGALKDFGSAWDNIKSIFGSLISIIGNIIKSFLGIDESTVKNASSVENVAKSIAILAGKLSDVTKKIADFMKKISESKTAMDLIKGAIVGLSAGFVAFKIGKGVIAGIEAFIKLKKAMQVAGGAMNALKGAMSLGVWGVVIAAIAAVVAGLVYFFTQTETGKKVWQGFVDFLSQSIEAIKSFFAGLGSWFSETWTSIVEGTKTIWNGITEFFSGLWQGIVNIVTTVFITILSIVTGAYNWFVTTFQPLISFYQSIFGLIGSIINLAFQVIIGIGKTAYNLIIGAWQGLSAWFGGIFNAVSNVVSTVFSAIGSFASSAWAKVQSVWSVVSGFFSGIFNAVSSVVSGVFSAIGSFASNAWSRVSSAFSPVVGFFSGVFNSAKNAVSGALGALGGIASNAFNAVTGAFKGIVGFFSDIFGSVKKVVDNVLGGITGTIDKITGAVNGVAGKVKGFFGGSMVAEMRSVNLGASGIMLNSASAGTTTTTNTFHIQAGQMNTTALARAIKREIDNGRA